MKLKVNPENIIVIIIVIYIIFWASNLTNNYPLKLVHTSPSFSDNNIDRFNAVLVYEVNKNYISSNDDLTINENIRLEN